MPIQKAMGLLSERMDNVDDKNPLDICCVNSEERMQFLRREMSRRVS